MELYRTGALLGMQSLIALIKISTAILTKGCICRFIRSLTILILPPSQIIQLYDVVMACHPPLPQLDQEKGQRDIWKLALRPKKFRIWDGHYSDKTHYLLIFNTSTNWTFYIQSCVRDSYVLSKGTVSINGSVHELSCQDCKLYTCLNSSLYNSNHSFVTLRRRLGIWLPVNQTRPWEGSPETHALLKVIKKVLQRFKSLLDSL